MATQTTFKGEMIQDPPIAKQLFNNTRAAWLWLPLRLWVGYQWIEASLHKINNPAWTQTGEALKGYWMGAVAIPAEGRPPIAFGWYRTFIESLLNSQSYEWFAPLVAYGELLVGIALIIGAFTGIAAFFGAFMNWNYIMAGSASTNPMLLIISIGLIMAWKIAGDIGLDYYLLRKLGTPWMLRREGQLEGETAPAPAD